MTKTKTIKIASEKQIIFLANLLDERKDIEHPAVTGAKKVLANPASLSKNAASTLIDGLLAVPKPKKPIAKPTITEPGIYRHDGNFYRVRWNRAKTNLYAEQIIGSDDHADFMYAPGVAAKLTDADKLTWQEARDFGKAFNVCINCGHKLTDPPSLVQGYGPTCADNMGWPKVTKKQAEQIIDGLITFDEVIADKHPQAVPTGIAFYGPNHRASSWRDLHRAHND